MIRKWTYLILTALCLVFFSGYLKMDSLAQDTVAPSIHIEETPLGIFIADPDSVLFQGITATDNIDGDVSNTLLVENITLSGDDGQATVTYAAFDSSGNVTKAKREIRYIDYEGPRIDLKQPLIFTENFTQDVLSLATAHDFKDGDISHWVRATALDGDNLNALGVHKVQFRVSNSLGDTLILELPVEVISAGKLQGQLELRDYIAYLKVGEPFDAMDYPLSYTLGNQTLMFKQKLPDNFQLHIDHNVDPRIPGLYEVLYTLIYTENGYSYTGYSKLFVVVEG